MVLETQTGRWFQVGTIGIGLLLFVGGAIVIALEPAWTWNPAGAGAALIAAGLTLIIMTVGRRRREASDEVVVDERVTSIGEKSGYRAYQVTFILQGVIFAVVGLTTIDLPLTPVLGGLFGLTGLSYIIAYNWYRRSM
jgi:uncharacterized membrane protein